MNISKVNALIVKRVFPSVFTDHVVIKYKAINTNYIKLGKKLQL